MKIIILIMIIVIINNEIMCNINNEILIWK